MWTYFSHTELGATIKAVGHSSLGLGLSKCSPSFILPSARSVWVQSKRRPRSVVRSPVNLMMAERKAMTWMVFPSLLET